MAGEIPKSKCPWGSVQADPGATTSFAEVMSEQLASDLQSKENKVGENFDEIADHAKGADALTDEELAKILSEDQSTSDDLLIAQMLQMQFDREHDQALVVEESHR